MKYPKLRELREAFKCIFTRPATHKYPYKAAIIHPGYRGKPEFQQEDCLACTACSEACPSGAIEVLDDVQARTRKVVRYLDRCITCGECERVCTCDCGVKMVPEFALAAYDRGESMQDSVEGELIVCDDCGSVITSRKHILWMQDRLKEKGAAHMPFVILGLKELGIAEEVELESITLDKRQDLFAILCPRCRHKVVLYDSR